MKKHGAQLLGTAALMGFALGAQAIEVPGHKMLTAKDFQTQAQHIRSATAKNVDYGEMLIFWNKPKPYGTPEADRLLINGEPEDGVREDGKCAVERIDFKDGDANVILDFYRGRICDDPSHPEGAMGEIRTFQNGQWSREFIFPKNWQFK